MADATVMPTLTRAIGPRPGKCDIDGGIHENGGAINICHVLAEHGLKITLDVIFDFFSFYKPSV